MSFERDEIDTSQGIGHLTFNELAEWHIIGARCAQCGYTNWLDRWQLAKKYGADTPIAILRPHLVCSQCGNREGNGLRLGRINRNA
ncbi:hypothetical protein [Sinorhizobium fredii]|uniref:hypothetical protein n=1 Tax=Rhizobium fredii TaxID=380 RepID=UPI0004B83440|nr:hypothetical protein [Sinorhizobium fredii]